MCKMHIEHKSYPLPYAVNSDGGAVLISFFTPVLYKFSNNNLNKTYIQFNIRKYKPNNLYSKRRKHVIK